MDISFRDSISELKQLYDFMFDTAKSRGNLHGSSDDVQLIKSTLSSNLDL